MSGKVTSQGYAYSQELADLQSTFDFVERTITDDDSRRDTIKDNAGRQAFAECYVDTVGSGQQRINKALRFPITFRQEPHLVTGCATIRNPDPAVWHDPIGAVGIWAWLRDLNGNYLGAKVWTRVDIFPVVSDNTTTPPQNTKTRHYLTFTGFAIKDLPTNTLDPQVTPHEVDLLSGYQKAILKAQGNA